MTDEITCLACAGTGLREEITYEYDKNGNAIPIRALSGCVTCNGNGKIRT